MNWWSGGGAAPVLAHDGDALLMERAQSDISLTALAHGGRDDEASRTMCAVLNELHAPRAWLFPDLVPLEQWFAPLNAAAFSNGGILQMCASVASNLLANPHEISVLHGDMHHGNVLNFGARGWLAIDPKGLIGEKYFDYANILCNPDRELAIAQSRLRRQVNVIAKAADLDSTRLLAWVVAWAGLSAAFLLEEGAAPERAIEMAELAAVELNY